MADRSVSRLSGDGLVCRSGVPPASCGVLGEEDDSGRGTGSTAFFWSTLVDNVGTSVFPLGNTSTTPSIAAAGSWSTLNLSRNSSTSTQCLVVSMAAPISLPRKERL